MSTSGPRRRALVIPAATIARVLPALLADGHVARGWLGVGLQPVAVPESLRAAAGCDAGMMVVTSRPHVDRYGLRLPRLQVNPIEGRQRVHGEVRSLGPPAGLLLAFLGPRFTRPQP